MSSAFLEFKVPAGPSQMPQMASDDEESFVILGKALIPDVDLSIRPYESCSSFPVERIEQAQEIIVKSLENAHISSSNEAGVTLSVASSSSEFSLGNVQGKVDQLVAENTKLRETIIKNNSAMEIQHEKFVQWKEEVQKTHQTHKAKFTEAKEYILKLKNEKELLASELEKSNEIRQLQQNELFELKNIIKTLKNGSPNPQKSPESPESSMVHVEIPSTLKQNNTELGNLKNKIEELEALVQTLNASKDKIHRENLGLKEKLEETEKLKNDLVATVETHSNQLKSLNLELMDTKSQLCAKNAIQEDIENARTQLMHSQAVITNLQQEKSQLASQLTSEQAKIREFETLKDHQFALEEQVNQYKTDFEAELELNKTLKTEKEQIMSDFLNVQRRNNELNEELDLFIERGTSLQRRSPRQASAAQSDGAQRYVCPICSFGFKEYQACENHVTSCLDLISALP